MQRAEAAEEFIQKAQRDADELRQQVSNHMQPLPASDLRDPFLICASCSSAQDTLHKACR